MPRIEWINRLVALAKQGLTGNIGLYSFSALVLALIGFKSGVIASFKLFSFGLLFLLNARWMSALTAAEFRIANVTRYHIVLAVVCCLIGGMSFNWINAYLIGIAFVAPAIIVAALWGRDHLRG